MLSKEEKAEKYVNENWLGTGRVITAKESFLAGYTARDEEDGWVSVDDRLPENSIPVLLWHSTQGCAVTGFYNGCGFAFIKMHLFISTPIEKIGDFVLRDYDPKQITHWRPLPSKPIEK